MLFTNIISYGTKCKFDFSAIHKFETFWSCDSGSVNAE